MKCIPVMMTDLVTSGLDIFTLFVIVVNGPSKLISSKAVIVSSVWNISAVNNINGSNLWKTAKHNFQFKM